MQASSFVARVVENRVLAPHTFVLRLGGCAALKDTLPGQFVMMRGEWGRDPLLPRAFSLLSVVSADEVTVLIKSIGRGTSLLSHTAVGAELTVLGPLGGAFRAPDPARHDLLVAGGVGLAPIMMQAELATRRGLGAQCEILYGARTAADLVLRQELAALDSVVTHYATEDGSVGSHGRVTAPLAIRLERLRDAGGPPPTIMACGPNPMLTAVREVARKFDAPCFVSLEGEMACGYGVCLGCAVSVTGAAKSFRYVCKDGPVFDGEEVSW